jgi:hypothetical protein
MKMNFFFPCLVAFRKINTPKNILQCCAKDRAEGADDEMCVFEKWFTKKLGVNHFPNFNKGFSGQRKLFSV